MKKHRLVFAAVSVTALFTGTAQAGAAPTTYTTQITGNFNGSFELSRIEVVWSTSVAFGNLLDETGLTDLTISLYDNSNTLFYTDAAIIGGVRQPIGGVSRDLGDVEFSGVSGVSIASFDNDLNQVQLGAATGTTYNLYGSATLSINVASYLNGGLLGDDTFIVTSQSTSAVPEPSSYAALAGLAGLGFAVARRRRD
jgi:hypothetical protein